MTQLERRRIARGFGVAVHALVLGTALFLTALRLMQVASDAHVFRYQGF